MFDAPDQDRNIWADSIALSSRYIALLAAWIATSGSLFFSEILNWTPCLLCWYQRILMYPLSLILAVGLLRRDTRLHWYVLPFSLLGACVSLYHYLLQKTTWFPPPACSIGVSCSVDYINLFGFVTIPFLALTAFLIITLMMVVSMLSPAEGRAEVEASGISARLNLDRVTVFAMIGTVMLLYVAIARLI